MEIINLVLNEFTNDSRVLKTSKSLRRLGYDVHVVALHKPGLAQDEIIDGLAVHRISLRSRGWSRRKLVQLAKLVEFIYRFIKRFRAARIIHCNDLDGLLVGVACKITNFKIKLVYDSHEFAINDRPNQSRLSINLHYILEWILIRFAVRVINVSNSIAEEYVRLYGIEKPYLVLNCPNYQNVRSSDLFREKFGIGAHAKIFLYQGGFSLGRGIEILLDAFSDLAPKDCVLVLMGYGPLEALVREKAKNSDAIFFHPAVSPDVLLCYTSSADYGILFYEDSCLNHRYCSPNKIFEYFMAGLPVLTSNLFEMKRLVESEGVGIVASENTSLGFKLAVKRLLSQDLNLLRCRVSAAKRNYSWENQEKILERAYAGL